MIFCPVLLQTARHGVIKSILMLRNQVLHSYCIHIATGQNKNSNDLRQVKLELKSLNNTYLSYICSNFL